jgi:hypothetical protein
MLICRKSMQLLLRHIFMHMEKYGGLAYYFYLMTMSVDLCEI